MKCPQSASAVRREGGHDQGIPMWSRVRFWVWGLLRQLGGHCHRVPGSFSLHGELGPGELGLASTLLQRGWNQWFMCPSTMVFDSPEKPRGEVSGVRVRS